MKSFNNLNKHSLLQQDWVDNDQGALELENAAYNADERDVAHKFIDMINELE